METVSKVKARRYAAWAAIGATFIGAVGVLFSTSKPRYDERDRRRVGPYYYGGRRPANSAQPTGETPYHPLATNTLKVSAVPAVGERPAPRDEEKTMDASVDHSVLPAGSSQSGPQGSAHSNARYKDPLISNGVTHPSYAGEGLAAGNHASSGASSNQNVPPTQAERQPAPKESKKSSDAGASSLSSDPRFAAGVSNIVKEARGLKISGRSDAQELSTMDGLTKAMAKQITADNAVDKAVRKRLDELGPDADIEAQRAATKEVLAAHGQPTDEKSTSDALGGAQTTGPAPEAPKEKVEKAQQEAVDAFANGTSRDAPKVGPPYVPEMKVSGDPCKIFTEYAPAFQAAEQKGMKPEHILAILDQETSLCRNMGKTPLLTAVARRPKDLAAAIQMRALGWLPCELSSCRGSVTGAQGCGQWQPGTSMWMRAGNPYDMNALIGNAIPKLMAVNGYKANDPIAQRRAYSRYYGDGNINGAYALSVAGKGETMKRLLANPSCAAKK